MIIRRITTTTTTTTTTKMMMMIMIMMMMVKIMIITIITTTMMMMIMIKKKKKKRIVILMIFKGAIRFFFIYNLLTAPRSVSTTHAHIRVAVACNSCATHGYLSYATRYVLSGAMRQLSHC